MRTNGRQEADGKAMGERERDLISKPAARRTNLAKYQQHQTNGNIMQANQNVETSKQQDGKRTLIKNQLYLIEQLQLENANLRNERDQLQLENEELKFQLQMIR